MSSLNIITISVFVLLCLFGLALSTLNTLRKQSPKARLREQLNQVVNQNSSSQKKLIDDLRRAQSESARRRRLQNLGSLGYYLHRLETTAGPRAVTLLIALNSLSLVLSLVLLTATILPQNAFGVLIVLALPFVITIGLYRFWGNRFNQAFTNQLPEALDLIIRASQAGIPVTQSIRNIGSQLPAPLGPEFRKIGDSLLLGNDLETVLNEAIRRLELPDFSFFAVCVLLQKETGGSIVETLENLADIIRARRDLALKTKALTAEGRFSGWIMSAIPFIVIGMMSVVNPDYIEVLFTTETGNMLLWIAGIMLAIGTFIINRLTKMET